MKGRTGGWPGRPATVGGPFGATCRAFNFSPVAVAKVVALSRGASCQVEAGTVPRPGGAWCGVAEARLGHGGDPSPNIVLESVSSSLSCAPLGWACQIPYPKHTSLGAHSTDRTAISDLSRDRRLGQ